MNATVNLLYLEPLPITGRRFVPQYLRFTQGEVEDRVAPRAAGRGSPLVAAVTAAGGTFTRERSWPDADRNLERELKRTPAIRGTVRNRAVS